MILLPCSWDMFAYIHAHTYNTPIYTSINIYTFIYLFFSFFLSFFFMYSAWIRAAKYANKKSDSWAFVGQAGCRNMFFQFTSQESSRVICGISIMNCVSQTVSEPPTMLGKVFAWPACPHSTGPLAIAAQRYAADSGRN